MDIRCFASTIGALAALGLAAGNAWAQQDALDDQEPRDGAFCSATAATLHAACGADTRDNYLVAKAKCINVSDAGQRSDCFAEARTARTEANQACSALLKNRRAACAVLGEQRYDPKWDAALFDSDFRNLSNPNPYFPLTIGNKWEYRGGNEYNVIEVVNQSKLIDGVTCIVERDLVFRDKRLVEATDDWYAAARDGASWYCGEEVKDYESFAGDRPQRPELVKIDGSFKQGRERDKAGIIMPGSPKLGQVYLEEFSLANAEDVSEILSTSYAYGTNKPLDRMVPRELAQRLCGQHDCVVTKNYSLLEPGIFALKYYARGIGFFLEIEPDKGLAVQLVNCNFDARCAGLPAP
jgi:hypothetical protein